MGASSAPSTGTGLAQALAPARALAHGHRGRHHLRTATLEQPQGRKHGRAGAHGVVDDQHAPAAEQGRLVRIEIQPPVLARRGDRAHRLGQLVAVPVLARKTQGNEARMAQAARHGGRQRQAQRRQPDHGIDREAARLLDHGLGQRLHHLERSLVGQQRCHAAPGIAGQRAQRQQQIATVAQPRGIAALVRRRRGLRQLPGRDDALPVAAGGVEAWIRPCAGRAAGPRLGCRNGLPTEIRHIHPRVPEVPAARRS